MISHHDIEAFQPELSEGAEEDAAILDDVERRVTLGVAKHREMTQAESLSILRMAVRYRNGCEALLQYIFGQGELSMSIHGNGERKPCSDPSS